MSSRRAIVVTFTAALAACAQPATRAWRVSSREPSGAGDASQPTAARAPITPGDADAIFSNAVQVLAADGYGMHTCDAKAGAVTTKRLEVDVPCSGGSCLARQWLQVNVGYRVAKVVVARELWDASVKTWVPVGHETLKEGVAADEAELLARILDVGPGRMVPRPTREGGADPCHVPSPCEIGVCAAARP